MSPSSFPTARPLRFSTASDGRASMRVLVSWIDKLDLKVVRKDQPETQAGQNLRPMRAQKSYVVSIFHRTSQGTGGARGCITSVTSRLAERTGTPPQPEVPADPGGDAAGGPDAIRGVVGGGSRGRQAVIRTRLLTPAAASLARTAEHSPVGLVLEHHWGDSSVFRQSVAKARHQAGNDDSPVQFPGKTDRERRGSPGRFPGKGSSADSNAGRARSC
jgi:hypothetical protein